MKSDPFGGEAGPWHPLRDAHLFKTYKLTANKTRKQTSHSLNGKRDRTPPALLLSSFRARPGRLGRPSPSSSSSSPARPSHFRP